MSDEPKKRSRAWIWWLVFFFALYPALYGPATLLMCVDDTGLVEKAYQIVYGPTKWATGLSGPTQTARNRYLGWWTKSVTGP